MAELGGLPVLRELRYARCPMGHKFSAASVTISSYEIKLSRNIHFKEHSSFMLYGWATGTQETRRAHREPTV